MVVMAPDPRESECTIRAGCIEKEPSPFNRPLISTQPIPLYSTPFHSFSPRLFGTKNEVELSSHCAFWALEWSD